MTDKEQELPNLQNRVRELEGQLAAAQGTIRALQESTAQALESSRNRINDILKSLSDGLLALDRQWSITYINEQAARIGGFPAEGLIGKTLWELWPQLQGTAMERFYRQAMEAGIPAQFRVQGIQTGRWYDVNVYPSSEGITIFYVDKTEQILAEERFNQAFHASPNALVISRQEDGRIETINEMFVKFFGYSREEVIGKTSTELHMFVNPADRQASIRKLQADGSVRDFEIDVRLKSGEIRNVSLSVEKISIGSESMMVTTIQDITVRKRAEEALRESEQRYRKLFETMQEGLISAEIITDEHGKPIDYRYLDVNPAAERQFGIPRQQFIGHTYTEVLHEGDQKWIETLGRVALTGEPVSIERYREASGRWFEAHAYSPRPGQVVSILMDITERKRVEHALQASEAKMRAVFQSLVEGVIFINSKGEMQDANDAVQHTFGHTFQELTEPALDPRFGIVPHHRNPLPEEAFPALVALRTGEAVRDVEIGVPSREGSISWRLVNAQPIYDDQGTLLGAVASFFDITERKQFEAALRKRESILAQAGEMAHLGAWDIELNNQGDVNANPLAWSDEVYRIFGYAPGEVEPSNELFFERVHPDDRALVQESVAQAIALRQPYMIEHRVCRPDGEERIVREHAEVFFDESGQPTRIVGAVQDITERRRAEQAVRESEERFHSLADSMPQLVWTATPDGTVDYYNQRYREYQDITPSSDGAWEWSLVLHPDDLPATLKAWQHSVETGETYQIEHRVRMINGSFRWHLSRGVPVFDEQHKIVRWFGTATDIHEQKLAAEKLKDYAERLEASNRELEQFAFMASHDLQEPLRKIQVFGELLVERAETLTDRERDYIERMRNAAARMRDMVNGLLQLSRVTTQAKPFTRVDLAHVTREVLSDLDHSIQRSGGKVRVSALPTLIGDPQQLHQLMQNLIGNALKYHQPGVAPEVNVYAIESVGNIQIIVEDHGIGFEQEAAERLFKPFQRLVVRSEYEGSGIGLAICRRIVEHHNGKISAQSTPGQGATFIVTLPTSHPSTDE